MSSVQSYSTVKNVYNICDQDLCVVCLAVGTCIKNIIE